MANRKAFTLIEILIVVSILGILAAFVIPEFRGKSQQAKESTAKEMIQMLRGQIELYKVQHNGMPPGYLNGNMSAQANGGRMVAQLTYATNLDGDWATPGTLGYDYGPYMDAMSKNIFNGADKVWVVSIDPKVTALSSKGGDYGWQYYGPTRMVRLNTFGTDDTGMDYQDY